MIIMILIQGSEQEYDYVFRFWIIFYPFTNVKAGLPAQDNIKDYQVRFFLTNYGNSLIGRDSFQDTETLKFQKQT